jgi:uncharacterized protein (DUF2126 family)
MMDGRHTGTGGGNHITIGATSPKDSPFFRNKELLPSLITYWQHHPSLSYLFSGLFVGPTSQSPRPDEGKEDALYELEVALNQIQDNNYTPPWLIDRLLRNILMDITGNNHRTEICIDKLFPTDSHSRRLGLIELRAFEMPPHYQMSLAQQLFILSLLTRLWEDPYQHKLVRWGTGLHDKFMLPHYVWKDFTDILSDLGRRDFPFLEEDFLTFFEFRFPIYGSVQIDDIKIELRMALEPWYVLGDELTSLGVSRSVDSAVERIEVKVNGLTNERYILTCNGYEVPLHSTGKFGEAVCGVRFKAWNPPFTLHPNIPVHSPLTFDLYDTWNSRSIGGCTYHVSHPGGTSYNKLPVNGFEAESRRISRFWSHGHSQGIMNRPVKIENPEFPHTLDLRKARLN